MFRRFPKLCTTVAVVLCIPVVAPAQVTTPAGAPVTTQASLNAIVVDSASGMRLPFTYVALIDGAGRIVSSRSTNASGAVLLDASRPGSYRVLVRRLGFQSYTSAPVEIASGATHTMTIAMPSNRVALQPVLVRERACGRLSTGDTQLREAWEQVRTALYMANLVDSVPLMEIVIEGYQRDTVFGFPAQTISRGTGLAYNRSFRSLPPDDLARRGYIRSRDGDWEFHGPDTHTLLSQEFEATHCFSLDYSERHPAIVFEPTQMRRPDIRGRIVLDSASLELRSVEFGYSALPRDLREGNPSGTVQFDYENGWAYVSSWSLTMPLLLREKRGTPATVRGRSTIGGWAYVVR